MQLLKVPEVAELLQVSEWRAYQLVREGILPAVHLGRQVRIPADKLREFVESGGKRLDGGWRRAQ